MATRIRSLKWVDSEIFGEGGRRSLRASSWPIISRLSLRLPAGEIVKVPIARALPFLLQVSVRTGVFDLWYGPACPTEEQADIRVASITRPWSERFPQGAYTLYVRAADGRPLTANLTAIGETYG